jgi:hypothetical protein
MKDAAAWAARSASVRRQSFIEVKKKKEKVGILQLRMAHLDGLLAW